MGVAEASRLEDGPLAGGAPTARPGEIDAPSGVLTRWVLERFEAYGRVCLVAAVLLSALAIDVGASDAFSLIKLTTIWTFGILAVGFWLARAATSSGARQRGVVEYLTVGLLATCGASTVTSIAPRVSVLGLPGRYNGLIPIAVYATMMFACVGLFRSDPRRLSVLAWAGAAAGGIIAGYVCIQAAGLDPGRWSDPSTKLRPDWPIGTLGNSNFAGGYLAMLMPFAIYVFVTRRSNPGRYVGASLFGLEALAVWYTQTRGGMIAAGCSVLVMGLAVRQYLPRWLRRLGVGMAAASLLAAIVVVWHPGLQRAPGALDRVRTSTLESRLAFWRVGTQVAIEHPVLGTGLDTFYATYPPRRPANEAVKNGLQLPDEPHNIYLAYASGAGLGAFACYTALMLVTAGMAWRALRRCRGADVLLLACFGSLVAYGVQGFFSIDEPPLAVLGWITIGATLVLARSNIPVRVADKAVAARPPLVRASSYGLLAVTVPICLVIGVLPLRASVVARNGDFSRAMRLQPLDFTYPMDVGDLNRLVALATGDPKVRVAHLQLADKYYRIALRLKPGELDLLLKLAVTNGVWADTVEVDRFPEAERWWALAHQADPRDPQILAEHNASIGSMRSRGAELAQVALADQNNVAEWVDAAKAFAYVGDTARARELVQTGLHIDPSDAAGRRLADALPS